MYKRQPSRTASTKVKAPTSDVRGRAFDFGQVTGAKRAGGVDVLVLDRWTDPEVDDEVVAKQGLPVNSWQVGSDRYVNQNDKKTFDIPVRDGVGFALGAAGDGVPVTVTTTSGGVSDPHALRPAPATRASARGAHGIRSRIPTTVPRTTAPSHIRATRRNTQAKPPRPCGAVSAPTAEAPARAAR